MRCQGDPVVVGITFSPATTGITLQGEIIGETFGDTLFDLPVREVIGKLAVQEAAHDMARQLAGEAARIAQALQDKSRVA